MSRHARTLRFFILIAYFLATPALSRGEVTGFVEQKIMFSDTSSTYHIYIPPHWTDSDSWPIILFLHGSGERGHDGKQPTEVGLGQVIRRNPELVPAIVTFPQCSEESQWSDPDMERLAMLTIDRAIHKFKGDPTRVYLTGLSMGGHGAWHLAAKYPDRFAALAPIAARALYSLHSKKGSNDLTSNSSLEESLDHIVEKIAAIPTWVFHGRQDQIIPVLESRKMITALRKIGSQPLYTEFESVGHASWETAYAGQKFFRWLFAQRIRGRK